MFLGKALAIGLTIEIPLIVKSLSRSLFSQNNDYLCFDLLSSDMNSDLLTTPLVEYYMFNWWDNHDSVVRKIAFLLTLYITLTATLARSMTMRKYSVLIILKRRCWHIKTNITKGIKHTSSGRNPGPT